MGRFYGKGKLLSLEWNRDGVMHSESDDDHDDYVSGYELL